MLVCVFNTLCNESIFVGSPSVRQSVVSGSVADQFTAAVWTNPSSQYYLVISSILIKTGVRNQHFDL